MAYEAEKNRLALIISSTVGITRGRDSDLEREAQERSLEAAAQTGMNIGDADGIDTIVHPSAAERRARLNVPTTVGTAELATWNYLFTDPVEAAASGLLNSSAHRAVLNNPLYRFWGIGVHTAMPEGESNELLRRWWFIIWLSTIQIGTASMTQPDQNFSPWKYVSFPVGVHWAYQFDYKGAVMGSKKLTLSSSSRADAKGRGNVPGRSGDWLLMANGHFKDHWILERGFVAQQDAAKIE